MVGVIEYNICVYYSFGLKSNLLKLSKFYNSFNIFSINVVQLKWKYFADPLSQPSTANQLERKISDSAVEYDLHQ